MATFWPKHGPTGLNFDDFFDYFVFCVGSADEAEPCKFPECTGPVYVIGSSVVIG